MAYKSEEEQKEHNKNYYQAHREKLRKKMREYYRTHKEQKQEYQQANKEKIRKRRRERYQMNKDKEKAYYQAYYQVNKERYRKQHQEWYQIHKEELRKRAQEYRRMYKERCTESAKHWRKNNPGKAREVWGKHQNKRKRNLGFNPLNEWFVGSEAHHINFNDIIYIPKELHKSIHHNVWTGKNMEKINCLAYQFLFGNYIIY